MSPVLLGADIEESVSEPFPRPPTPPIAGLRAVLSAPDTARRKTTPSPCENARLLRKSGLAEVEWRKRLLLWSSRRTGWWSPCACKSGRGWARWAVGKGACSRDPGVGSRAVPRHGRAGRVLIPGLSLWDTRSFCKQVM